MIKELVVEKSIEINAESDRVWDALINPDKIKQYLFGTETISNWNVGDSIIFQGEYEGHAYKDKGNVIDIKEKQLLQYDYWSGFSGLEDKKENYSTVTYILEDKNQQTTLTLTQHGFSNTQAREHAENSWTTVLESMKQVIEQEIITTN